MSRAQRRRRHRKSRLGHSPVSLAGIWPEDGLCPLCGRPMVASPSLNEHHLIPKSQGGKEKFVLHRVCHAKIHSVFTEKELARHFETFEKLRAHPQIATFLKWVRKQPPEMVARHRKYQGE